MSEETALVPKQKLSEVMASELGMDSTEFRNVIKHTVMPSANVTNEHITAFLVLAKQYDMNPFSENIHAFPNKGGVKLIVGYDGYIQVANRNPTFQGFELHEEVDDQGNMVRVGCQIFRSDREHNPIFWEYMAECKRNTDPWKQFPKRMLRNKAIMQAVRAAYGTANFIDTDEARDMGFDQHGKELKEINPEGSGTDLEKRLETAAEEVKLMMDEEKKQEETNGSESEVKHLVQAAEEIVTKDVETKSGTVPFEVGESPKEIAKNKIGNYTRKRDLEAYLKAGEKLKWPAIMSEADVKDLVQFGKEKLKTFDV